MYDSHGSALYLEHSFRLSSFAVGCITLQLFGHSDFVLGLITLSFFFFFFLFCRLSRLLPARHFALSLRFLTVMRLDLIVMAFGREVLGPNTTALGREALGLNAAALGR